MGFTNVAWESRSTEQLARDLTNGPGPRTVGDAGAAWVRIANEFASVSADLDRLLERLRTVWDSQSAGAATLRLEEFSRWLRAASLSAAANGQRAEEAAVANTVAVLAMPTVTEAVEAKAAQDMMASLAAYNGAVLNGTFAEFDEAATADQANAAAVMAQYEESVTHFATPWDQPPPPQVTNAEAMRAETGAGESGSSAGGAGSVGVPPPPLMPAFSPAVSASADPKNLRATGISSAGAGGHGANGMGGGYAPMAGGMGRADQHRDYESVQPAARLEGAGELGAGTNPAWLPAAALHDAPFQVSSTSWGPDTAVFDDLVVPAEGLGSGAFDGELAGTGSDEMPDGSVTPPVLGVDRELRL